MLRSVARSSLLKRSIATQTALKAQVTELSNGMIVATESNSGASTSSIGVVFGSGSCSENPYNNGVSHLLSNAFKSVNGMSAAKKGFSLSSVVSRDFQSYIVNSTSGQTDKALEFLQSALPVSISDGSFHAVKSSTLKSVESFEENMHAERMLEHLHATAFQNTPLCLPVRGTIESLESLEKSDLESFAKNHFLSNNAVIVGSGKVDHDMLVKSVEKGVSLKFGEKPIVKKQSTFLGSDVRLRDDTLPKAWISIAAEGESITSPNYYVAQVAAQIFGSYVASEPSSRLQGIKLLDIINENHLCESFDHFSLSYKESGLWGFSTVTTNFEQIDDLIHFTLKQWNRLSISITETEVARGKALLKLKLASQVTDNAGIASQLGSQVLSLGSRPSLNDIFSKIDSITSKDIKAWASKRLWDQDIAVSACGQTEGVLDYMRMRNDMSMMRW